MAPKVSVIIPNYNHALYLPQRIESVLAQTFKNIEVILMDDCSRDNSREIIQQYAQRDPRIRIVFNEQNSGSTFKQWNKGIGLADGEYIWIAESDDYADIRILETLVSKADTDSAISLAYADSLSVDEHNKPLFVWKSLYRELDSELWERDFVVDGLSLVQKFMSFRNIIPNASAVLLRRTALEAAGPADETMKLLGDWLFWAKLIAKGRVAYVAEPLNYFRMHTNNVRSHTQQKGVNLEEATHLLRTIKQYGALDPYYYEKAVDGLLDDWFYAWIYYDIPWARHQIIYKNMLKVEPDFRKRFMASLSSHLFRRKLSGFRMLVGDKLLYPLLRGGKR